MMLDEPFLTLSVNAISHLPREAQFQIIIVELLRIAGWDGNLAADCPICKGKSYQLMNSWMHDLRHEDNCPVFMYERLTRIPQ